jgi:hypothetical protein
MELLVGFLGRDFIMRNPLASGFGAWYGIKFGKATFDVFQTMCKPPPVVVHPPFWSVAWKPALISGAIVVGDKMIRKLGGIV